VSENEPKNSTGKLLAYRSRRQHELDDRCRIFTTLEGSINASTFHIACGTVLSGFILWPLQVRVRPETVTCNAGVACRSPAWMPTAGSAGSAASAESEVTCECGFLHTERFMRLHSGEMYFRPTGPQLRSILPYRVRAHMVTSMVTKVSYRILISLAPL
jgi:hypothetical protein